MPPRNAPAADPLAALNFEPTVNSEAQVRVTHDGEAPVASTEVDKELEALHKANPTRRFWRGQGSIIYSESILPPEN